MPDPTSPGRRFADGYTLLEMLVVMLIISLAAGLTGTLLPERADHHRLAAEQRQLAAFLAAARTEALNTQRPVRISSIQAGHALACSPNCDVLRLNDLAVSSIVTDIRVTRTDQSIFFFEDGTNSGGMIKFHGPGDSRLQLHLNWLTGQTGWRNEAANAR